MRGRKMNKKYKIVIAKWKVIWEPEYIIDIECPLCKCKINYWDIDNLYEGEKYNKLCKCPICKEKFKLNIKEDENS
jgi:hypothetical protein